MKTIIAGSRGLKWVDVEAAMFACPWAGEISEVVSGCAPGVDRLCFACWGITAMPQLKKLWILSMSEGGPLCLVVGK